MRAGYFSIGALIGATFAGLWAGTVGLFAAMAVDRSDAPIFAYPLAVPGAIAGGGFLGFLVAVIATVPVAFVAAFIVFPLTRFIRGRVAPTRANAAALGILVGVMPLTILSISGAIANGSQAAPPSMIFAGAVGGAVAGLIYRALLFYRYPGLAAE
ncbi:hypothetical protein RB623_04985 [Mesorhizobium sp. LHD-90]|uniref:hypothetical protein n=1 Tax=Mesorhizobium sp. LHD-90 TaxID=3071414 RepID=UPI0027E08880|nr:hypothetical protein [Mesorhizobium sp. LHD-90]MDQ6433403.1 hypothetical protein [Mesorhizobium sp. LHD-90]